MNDASSLSEPTRVRMVNLTPHAIVLLLQDNRQRLIPASGLVARRIVQREPARIICLGGQTLTVNAVTMGDLEGLPDSVPGIMYIVSRMVAEVAADREDLLFPDQLVRDSEGRIVACRGFGCVTKPSADITNALR